MSGPTVEGSGQWGIGFRVESGWTTGGVGFSTRGPIHGAVDRPTVVHVTRGQDCEGPVWGSFVTVARHQSRGLRAVLTHGVSLIIALQTLANLGPLSAANRVAAVVMLVAAVARDRPVSCAGGATVDQAMLVAVVGLGSWPQRADTGRRSGVRRLLRGAVRGDVLLRAARRAIPAACRRRRGHVLDMFVGHFDLVGGLGNGAGAAFFGVAAMFWGRVLRASSATPSWSVSCRRAG